MDAIHYKDQDNHRYVTKAAYVVLGVTMEGQKDILSMWIGEYKSSKKFWVGVLNDLKRIGKIIYTTNIIEGLNRQFRQITKNKPSFTNDDSLHWMAIPGFSADHEALERALSELGFGPKPAGFCSKVEQSPDPTASGFPLP